MVIGAARHDTAATFGDAFGQCNCVVAYLVGIGLELGLASLGKSHRLGGHDVGERAA